MQIYFTFKSTHIVILAEKHLLSAGYPVKVRPLPSIIRQGCGLCLSVPFEMGDLVESEMKKHSINIFESYLYKDDNFSLIKSN